MSEQELERLIDKFKPLGIFKAGELLLRPEDALRFADELEKSDAGILGVDLWYLIGDSIAEDPASMDLSGYIGKENWRQTSVAAAKKFISSQLPTHIVYVSFVLDIQG